MEVAISADNEICILELTDKQGNKEWRVADNVSMSYNELGIEINLKDAEQVKMVYNIWNNAKVFNNANEASEYMKQLLDENYYEYGCAWWDLNIDWADLVFLYRGE